MHEYKGTVIRHNLKFAKAIEGFREYLKGWYIMSEGILKNVDFTKGTFFTLLPEGVPENQLYTFKYGGVLPQPPQTEDMPPNAWPIPNTNDNLSQFLFEYLNGKKNPLIIFENYLSEELEEPTILEGVRNVNINDETYILIQNCIPNYEAVEDCVWTSKAGRHYLSLLSENIHDIKNIITVDDFQTIYTNIQYIIIGAYDGEGYVYWEKTK